MDNQFTNGAKRISVKKNGKLLHEFIVTKKELKVAEKLGISRDSYITAKAKIQMEEKEKNGE